MCQDTKVNVLIRLQVNLSNIWLGLHHQWHMFSYHSNVAFFFWLAKQFYTEKFFEGTETWENWPWNKHQLCWQNHSQKYSDTSHITFHYTANMKVDFVCSPEVHWRNNFNKYNLTLTRSVTNITGQMWSTNKVCPLDENT